MKMEPTRTNLHVSKTGLPVQEAGRKLEDPNWRIRPASLPRFGACTHKSSNGPVTPGQSPVTQRGASSAPATNGHAKPRFRFGVPSAQYLSFAGPGGDDFADGEPLACCTERLLPGGGLRGRCLRGFSKLTPLNTRLICGSSRREIAPVGGLQCYCKAFASEATGLASSRHSGKVRGSSMCGSAQVKLCRRL